MACRRLLLALLIMICPAAAFAADGLREAIGDLPLASFWIYDDLPRATSLAKTTDKPLLVLFRCVPCQCMTKLDAAINDPAAPLNELLKQYVCVRLVHMAGVDLTKFQFDWDVSLVAILMNADGTIYGRYGTRASRVRTEDTHISPASLARALERGLQIHSHYPANRSLLAGKQPRAVSIKRPEDASELAAAAAKPITRTNCIHCHMAGEALLRDKAAAGKLGANDIWRFPLPDNLGAVIDKEDGLKVKNVRKDSPAERAGLLPGDVLRTLNGQTLISQGDVQWVLNDVPAQTQLKFTVDRGGQPRELVLTMSGDWKRTDLSWRPSLGPIRNGLHLGPPSAGERRQYGLESQTPALLVRYAFRAAAKAGLRGGDVLLEMDGQPIPALEGDFLAHCRLREPAPKEVRLKVRNKQGQDRDVILLLGIELVPE